MSDKDSPHQEGSKADLYSILKRRKKTVKSYIIEHGIDDKNKLISFLENKKKEFILSKIFLKECMQIVFASVEKTKKPNIVDGESLNKTVAKKERKQKSRPKKAKTNNEQS